LLADTGVPPLTLIQYTHLAQLHFRLTKTRPDTLPATVFKTFNKPLALSNLHPSTLDYYIRNSLHQLHIDPLADPLPHMATLSHKSLRVEHAYRNILRTTISTLRIEHLNHAPLHLPHTNCTKASYIYIAREDLQRRDLFKPAQYLCTHFNQLNLLCLQTQATSYIPSHLHLATHTPPMTNAIAPLAFQSRSWVINSTPSYTAPTLPHFSPCHPQSYPCSSQI